MNPSEQRGQPDARERARRRARLAEVFGDVLPDTTTDERDDDVRRGEDRASEEWLRSQVPPHHGS